MTDVTDEIFGDVVVALEQVSAHVNGERMSGMILHVPDKLDVAAIRRRTGHSQSVFAGSIGVKVSTLKQWEQGRRSPQGPARVLLAILDKDPQVVTKMLTEPS